MCGIFFYDEETSSSRATEPKSSSSSSSVSLSDAWTGARLAPPDPYKKNTNKAASNTPPSTDRI
eukprot:m.48227 g.48227  ORF g.48227 m.48227 type:complete len:64 (+) comp10558_c0_seq1:58-249(+)